MNEPGVITTAGVVFWLFLVTCFVFGFASMYKNPRKAWERGYHRQGLMRLLGRWPDREGATGEPTAGDLAEVRRRSILGLVIGLVLSPAIVAAAMLAGQARKARIGEREARIWGNLYKVEVGMTVEDAQRIMGGPGNRGTPLHDERLSWDFVDAEGRHWKLCVDVKDGKVAEKYKIDSASQGAASSETGR